MANRYWVGGTANWDSTAGTKWSATSGGAGGASVPTSADDVFFDANSTGTVTVVSGNGGAKSITCTGFTGTLTVNASISIAGSLTLVSGMTFQHTSGTITFTATGTITSAGKSFSQVTLNLAGTITLGDAFSAPGNNFTVTSGTFTTNNYSVSVGNFLPSLLNNPTLNFGSSTITVSGTFDCASAIINAGTSQLNLTGSTSQISNATGKTLYNVSFTNTSANSFTNIVSARRVDGAATFNNLTLTAASTGLAFLRLDNDITVNGTFTATSGSSGFSSRSFVYSSAIGTTRTITAAAISATDCDFRDITLAGAASGASPTRAGDCGGNSGITFPVAKTVYRVGSSTSWQGSSSWATSSGGAGSNTNFPLAQDTAVFDNSATPSSTFQIDWSWNIGTLNCASRTNAITLNFSAASSFYGSFILGSGVTTSSTGIQTFSPRGTVDFTSAGRSISFPVTIDGPGGTLRLGDAFSSTVTTFTLTRGTFNANNYNFTTPVFSSNNSNTRTITMGSGLWTISGSAAMWNLGGSNLTFNKDTANILFSSTGTADRYFAGLALSYNKITIGGATGISDFYLLSSDSFTELASTKTVAHGVIFGANLGTIGKWSITGTLGNIVTVQSSNIGVQRTFTLTDITSDINYLSVKDIGELSGNKFYVGANSTDGGNNSNVYFVGAPTGGAGNMMMLF